MKFTACFMAFLVSLQPFFIYANKSRALKKGQKAPFSGTLLDSEAVARILAEKKLNKARCQLEVSTRLQKEKAKNYLALNFCNISLKLQKTKQRDLLIIRDREIKRLAKKAFRPRRDLSMVWLAVGVLVGAGSTIAIAFAIKEVKK